MDKKVKNILYIDTEVFFTMLRKDRLDEITYKHLEMLAADESVRIKIPKSQHTHLHELRLDSMQHKQFVSQETLRLISYFLDKRQFVFVDDKDNDEMFWQKVLEDLGVSDKKVQINEESRNRFARSFQNEKWWNMLNEK